VFYVYVLFSLRYGKFYIGISSAPDKRLASHNSGRGGWSKRYRPWKRILLENYDNKNIATRRERYLKSGWGRRWLLKTLEKQERWQSG
jgi:putative endonuclease